MKTILQQLRKPVRILCMAIALLTAGQELLAQNCKQLEIIYDQPDCYKKRPNGTSPIQDVKGCPEVTVCKGQPYTYSASGSWSTYQWAVSGPTPVTISPFATSPTVSITWPQTGTYILTLTATDINGNVFTNCITLIVKDKPNAGFTFSPNNACAGSVVSFTNTTTFSGAAAYSWDFDDPSSGANNYSNQTNPTHIFNTPGVYDVTLIAYSFVTGSGSGSATGQHGDSSTIITCCADTIVHQVTVAPGSIHIDCISTVCAGDTAKYTAVGCANPTWTVTGHTSILNQSGNTITVVWGNGAVQGQLQVQCPGSCTAYAVVPIIPTNPQPVGNLSPCNTATTSYSLPLLPGTFYTWQLNNITSNTNHDNLLNTYPDNNTVWVNWSAAPAGTYELVVTLQNQHLCCNSTGKITITPKQTFALNPNPITVCAGSPTGIYPNQTGTFTWTVGPTSTGVTPIPPVTGPNYIPTFANAGTYIVTATNPTAFCNTSASATVTVVPVPTITGPILGPTSICINGTYTYSMPVPAPSGFYYEWQVTGGSFVPVGPPITGNSVDVQWTSLSGTLSVVMKRTTLPVCPSAPVNLGPLTQAVVGTVNGTPSVCVDGTGSYTLTGSTLPPGEVITWSIAAPNASLGTIISGQGGMPVTILWHGQTSGGPWGPVTLNASTACGNAVAQTNIMIYPKFTVSLSQSGNICQPGGVTITASGAPVGSTYTWSPAGPNSPTFSGITTPGTYTVLVQNGGCSFTKSLEVKDPFEIRGITCGVGVCNGTATNEQLGVQVMKPGSGTFTYNWYQGTYNTGTLVATTTGPALTNMYMATTPGNYYVTVTYGNCTKYVSFNVKKVCCPDVNTPVITNTTRLSCNTYTFTATTPNPGGAPITWNFGDGTTVPGSSGVPVTHTYTAAGIYCVTFCVGAPTPNPTNCTGNCTATTVVVPIDAAFSYVLGCNGCIGITDLSQIYTSPSNVSYFWDYGDGFTSASTTPPNHCYSSAGTYQVKLKLTYNDGTFSCVDSFTQSVTYTPLAINVTGPVCTGDTARYTSTPGGFVTYTWTFGDGYTAYTPNTTHIYNTPGASIPVSLAVTDLLGNTCTKNTTITVYPGISSCTIQPAYICPGVAATLTAPSGSGYTYQWEQYTGSNYVPAPGTNTNITYNTTVPGFYRVVVTNTNGCKCYSNKVEVKAAPKPIAQIAVSPSTNLCGPGQVSLSSSLVPGYTYAWYANSIAGAPLGTSFVYMPFVATTTPYILVVTNEYGCKDTCTMTINVNTPPAPPVIQSNPGGTLCAGTPIQLTVTNYANNITWNNGAAGTTITVSQAGNYIATYTHPVTGCQSSATITVNRRPPTDLFPHFCDSIPCDCIRPFAIYAPKPLVGTFAGNYTINWYKTPNTPVATGPVYNNLPTGVQTGSYYVIITDPMTGCKDTSDTYSVVVPPCDTCDCEKSHWGDITLTQGDNIPGVKNIGTGSTNPVQGLKCKENYILKCNQPYTINASYICADTLCPSKVTYTLTPPSGPAVSGTLGYTFTPTVSGTYTLMLYGWCDNKICDSCQITFTVRCVDDCCKGSFWKEVPTVTNKVTGKTAKIDCKEGKTYYIKGENCDDPLTIAGVYSCATANCPATVKIELYDQFNNLVTSGTGSMTIPPTLPNGTYYLNILAYCGSTLCDSCRVKIIKDCPEKCDCGKEKIHPVLTINGKPKKIECNADLGTLDCKSTIVLNATYLCVPQNCPGVINYQLTGPVSMTGTLPLTLSSLPQGSYNILLQAYCNGKLCDKCNLKFTIKCDSVSCCPYPIKVDTSQVTYTFNQQFNSTVVGQNFIINGLAGVPLTEVRAEVLSYTINDNYNKECMKCTNLPYTWASVHSSTPIAGIPPAISLFGSTVHPFNPTGPAVYQNPREVVWNNGSTFTIGNNTSVGMNFLLPPPPAIDCCELKGRICVKFIFRDANCKECEVISCFEFTINNKNKKPF